MFVLALLLFWGPTSAAAAAEFGIAGFSVRMLDAEGNPETRSGSHPDRLQIDFALETAGTGTSARDLAVEMPPGFGGDPSAVPACPRQAHEEGEECPSDSQVGIVSFGSSGTPSPIYVLEPEPGQVTSFTSKAGLAIPFQMQLRPSDFGITFAAEDLAEGAPSEGHIELWGVPAEHQEAPTAAPLPFLTAPSACGSVGFTLRVRSREEGAPWLSESAEVGPLTGCEDLRFAPKLDLRLSNPFADSPTGVRMALSMPAEEEGSELSAAQMKDVTIELPAGLSVSPAGLAGTAICTDAELGQDSAGEAACPAAARVGTVAVDTAVLPEPLSGAVYLGEGHGAERIRLFVVAPGPGFVIKLVTGLQPDATGRLAATLHDLPQVSINQIAMNLGSGTGGLLATPLGCGPARAEAHFLSYGGGPAVASTSTVNIASILPGLACPGALPFSPALLVSATSHRAGGPTGLTATLQRRGGEGLPARFTLMLPAGLSARLGSVEACPDPLAASGSCPAGSRVGSVRAEVGSGPGPAVLEGDAYAAGPYQHAPFSLVMAFRADIGPFHLGTVASRARALIDGRTGRVEVATDRLPSAVAGVPIRFRTIALSLDRGGLIHNPTSCGPHSFDAAVESQEAGTAGLSTPYGVSGCRHLGFSPRLRAALLERGRLHRHAAVGLRFSARFRDGDTAMRSLAVSLPPALKLNIGELKEICSRPDARRGLCPPGSRVGTSRARTPLLDRPLNGSIYVVQPRDDGEPDLWVVLSGGGVDLSIRGTSANDHGRFVTKLAGLPDLPLSSFTMRLGAAGDGLLSLEAGPCRGGRPRRLATEVAISGQNGARRGSRVAIATGASCATGRGR